MPRKLDDCWGDGGWADLYTMHYVEESSFPCDSDSSDFEITVANLHAAIFSRASHFLRELAVHFAEAN